MAIELTAENFDKTAAENGVMLVDFWAAWCGPCKMMAPVLEEVAAARPDVLVCKVNIDEQPELADRYGIDRIPYFAVFKNGEVEGIHIGLTNKDTLLSIVDKASR